MNTVNKSKTHCLRGHEFTPVNTRVYSGRRHCMECKRRFKRIRRARGGIAIQLEDRRENLRSYGISLEDYDAMFTAQGGCCAICKSEPVRRRLDVDHCHTTGVVRGLLCPKCNRGIGYFNDNPQLLAAAAAYVMPHKLEVVAL